MAHNRGSLPSTTSQPSSELAVTSINYKGWEYLEVLFVTGDYTAFALSERQCCDGSPQSSVSLLFSAHQRLGVECWPMLLILMHDTCFAPAQSSVLGVTIENCCGGCRFCQALFCCSKMFCSEGDTCTSS
jgi:hypothetical protein